MASEEELLRIIEGDERVPSGWERWSEMVLAIGFLMLGMVVLVGAQDIRVTASTQVSPRVIPQAVGVGIIVIGIWYVVDIIRKPHEISAGEDSEDVDIDAPTNWRTLITIGIALTLFALTVRPLGFALASALLFATSAFGMGSNRHVANVLIGVILGLVVFLVFDTWLGVRLPSGILEDILP